MTISSSSPRVTSRASLAIHMWPSVRYVIAVTLSPVSPLEGRVKRTFPSRPTTVTLPRSSDIAAESPLGSTASQDNSPAS